MPRPKETREMILLHVEPPLVHVNIAESIADQRPTSGRLVPPVVVRSVVREYRHGGELVILNKAQRLSYLKERERVKGHN